MPTSSDIAAEGPRVSPFAHGVASFDPGPDRVLLWTRVDEEGRRTSATVGWQVSREPGGPVVVEGRASVPADTGGCVMVDVEGLDPATTYHYWFDLDGTLSPIGRTRTLPDGPTEWLRLAVVCCADRSKGVLAAYRAVARDEVDLVLHLGDYIYEEPKGTHPVDPPDTCVTLDDYRRRHAHMRLDPDLQALHLRHPMVFVWDDHDVADNAWRHGAKAHDPEQHGDWEARLRAAQRARDEWLPARLVDGPGSLAMWRSLVFGDLAELVVLDTRIPGRDQPYGDEGAKPLDDPDRTLLDGRQRQWAHDRVRDRTRPWCLLASQVPVGDLELPVPLGGLVDDAMPSGYEVVDGEAVCTDLWEGYPVERRALLDVIEDRGGGVVVIAGDVHSSWAAELLGTTSGDPIAVELVCSSVSATPMADQLPSGWRRLAERAADDVPHQVWHDLERNGYLRVDVRRDEVRADWYAADPAHPASLPQRLASYAVSPTRAPDLSPVIPSSPIEAAGDAVRPGVPLAVLPEGASVEAKPRGLGHVLAKRGLALAIAGAAMAVGALVRRRSVRRRYQGDGTKSR